MQERVKMNTFHVKNKKKKHQCREKYFHSFIVRKNLNLKLFNLLCTYLYVYASAFKTQQTTILENWQTLSYIKQLSLYACLCRNYAHNYARNYAHIHVCCTLNYI